MANNESYQPDPQDLQLARLLDREHVDEEPSADADPLLPFLKEFKVKSEMKIRADARPGLFRDIQNQIDYENDKARVFRLHPAFWRVAAVILVAAILSLIYLFTDLRQPELLAESGSSIMQTTLIDGSQVTLRPYSAIYTLTESEVEQRYEIRGEAYFEVEQLPGRDFIVMTEFAMARITGTSFTISSWGQRSRVFLESGSLLFSMPDGSHQVELTPGQFSQTFNGEVSLPREVTENIYLGWLRDELVMDSRPLIDVVDEISQHFNIIVEVPPAYHEEELSGTLLLDDPEQILEDIAISIGLGLIRVDQGQYRLSEN